jgi:hypothetical protein
MFIHVRVFPVEKMQQHDVFYAQKCIIYFPVEMVHHAPFYAQKMVQFLHARVSTSSTGTSSFIQASLHNLE